MPQILVNFVSWVNLQSNSSLEDYRTTETTAWYYAMRPQTPESPELRLSRLVKMVIATPQLQRSAIEQNTVKHPITGRKPARTTNACSWGWRCFKSKRAKTDCAIKIWGIFAGGESGRGDAKEGWLSWRSRVCELQSGLCFGTVLSWPGLDRQQASKQATEVDSDSKGLQDNRRDCT